MSLQGAIQGKSIYMLYLLPFLLAGIVAISGGEGHASCGSDEGVIVLPFMEGRGLFWAGVAWILLISYLLFFIADRYTVLAHATVLPALIYSLLSIGLFCHHGVNSYMIAAAIVAVALARLQSLIARLKANAPIYDFGLLVAVAVLLCPKLLLLVPWAILVLPFSGRSTLRDVMVLLLGLCTATLLAGAYFFLFDEWGELPARFTGALHAGSRPDYLLSPRQWVATVLLLAVLLVSVVHVLGHVPAETVARRRGLLAMMSLLLFLGSTLFFIPMTGHGFLYVLFIPLSYVYSQYFLSYRGRWTGNTLFLLLLVACLLMIV
jgi:hypothetical protein